MSKKELLTPFIVAALSLLFITICLMVFISGGKSKKWVARKMKIGGLLLSFYAISSGTGCVTCYDYHEPDKVMIDGSNGYSIDIDLDIGNTLTGKIVEIDSTVFSFSITDTANIIKQASLLTPVDGQFGGQTEYFRLEIDEQIPAGCYYFLKIFACNVEAQDTISYLKDFTLNIKND